jgi:hypothetical protein
MAKTACLSPAAGDRQGKPAQETGRGNRMNRTITLIASFAAALVLIPDLAPASQQGTQVIKSWKTSDNCARQAQTAFPDFTAEANAKRDAKLKECLEANRLAPRAPNAPSQ